MPGKKLLAIAAFYRNDHPNGLGITFGTVEAGEDLNEEWQIVAEEYDLMWKASVYNDETAQLTAELFEQLEKICRKKPHLTMNDQLLAIGNIYLLEKVGKLKSDDVNGIDLIYGSEL